MKSNIDTSTADARNWERGGLRAAPVNDSPLPPSALGLSVIGDDRLIDRIADSRLSVLITGETGAGKEVLARSLHTRSPRACKPLVVINCAAICDSLIESELFGYERGSFTGAAQSKMGLIEAADGGTLFLDEVAELSLSAQAKLLRVIETRMVTRVGAVSPRSVDVRFVAATNRDLDLAVEDGGFRDDLRFRLDGIRLIVPPLRDRPAEILPAARGFLLAISQRDGLPLSVLTEEAEIALLENAWKGNFRELRNVVERAAVICKDGRIEVEDLLLSGRIQETWNEDRNNTHRRASAAPAVDRDRILSALRTCAGNQTSAAKILGISRRTLISRLDPLGIARPRTRRLRVVAAD
jgi:two-component system response regulator AtoC